LRLATSELSGAAIEFALAVLGLGQQSNEFSQLDEPLMGLIRRFELVVPALKPAQLFDIVMLRSPRDIQHVDRSRLKLMGVVVS